MPAPQPKIGEQFWFDASERLVTSALERRDQAADRLQTFATWLWSVFTAATAVGFALAKFSSAPAVVGAVLAAEVLLLATYFLAICTRLPPLEQFDPRSPDEIREAFHRMTQSKHELLMKTQFAAGLAMIAVVVALGLASLMPLSVDRVPAAAPLHDKK